jgi:DNA-binding CsgD family transcriptional regulator
MRSAIEQWIPAFASSQMQDDMSAWAAEIGEIAASYGLYVLPRFNLGASEVARDADDQRYYASIFGWTGKEGSWHHLTERRMCPLADVCRHQTEPFWSTALSAVQSRSYTAYLEKIDMSWLWAETRVRAILTVPVHMLQAQVGLVHFITDDENFVFEPHVDELAFYSREFLTTYAKKRIAGQSRSRHQPLSPQEIECLNWAFQGKTDREIAEITGRSYSTIRFYMSNAAIKLDSVNRAQTLAKAAVLGYFVFYT